MSELQLELRFPGGVVPAGTNVNALQDRLTQELTALSAALPRGSIAGPSPAPTPKGVAGIPELVTWTISFYLAHKEEIDATVQILLESVRGISALLKYFRAEKITLRIGGVKIDVPADFTSVDDLTQKVRKALEGERRG